MEIVLGTGHQASVRDVLRLIEDHLRRVEGVPRKIRAWTDKYEIIAERDGFEGDFERFTLRAKVSQNRGRGLDEIVQRYAPLATFVIEEGSVVIAVPAEGQETSPQVVELMDALSEQLKLPEVWRVAGDNYRMDRISVELLFQAMVRYKASDVHLSPGSTPVFRVDGDTRNSDLFGPLAAVQITALIKEIAPDEYWQEFVQDKQTSFNFHQVGIGYSRVSAFIKSGSPHCTFRYLPEIIPSFEELNVPAETMERLAEMHRGLLIVSGMTGSGKSTSCAALIDWINAHRAAHILTIENPVEYVHTNKRSILSQRSIGVDVDTFNDAVTGALRHDPDVILIGEMRDSDTIRAAINAAATGHLVITTLHASTASEVVNRIVSFFDPVERDLVKLQLRDALQCVICQRLVPRIGGGRVPAMEIMFNDVKAIADGILSGDSDLIRVGMQQTVSHSFLFEQYLHRLYKEQIISLERAHETCTDASVFDQLLMGTYSVPRLDSIKHHGTV